MLVRKGNETSPEAAAIISPENTGQGNTVGMSGGGQGAFLNVDPKRPDLSDKNRYNNVQRYGGAALRAGLGALSGVSALSRFSGSDEDAVSAAGGLAQDAYTTYGTTAGAERAIIGRGKEPEPEPTFDNKLMGRDKPITSHIPPAPDLEAQNNANIQAQNNAKTNQKAGSTVVGVADNPQKILDSIDTEAMERANAATGQYQ